ncbi:MAG TPA: PPK2 family polyphosphate kinase [Acidimicrobiales bacterium]|nr:PPK2 family polyphosphate kinase [Acidimicrobiales bacterium]
MDPKRHAAELARHLRVPPGEQVDLRHSHDPQRTYAVKDRAEAASNLAHSVVLLAELQERLAAQASNGVLLVLQGLDASGKDGTIKHVMTGVNPQGVDVHSFKVPSVEELAHDWMWRYQRAAPSRGRVCIFNRSHYEEVLVVRVHPELLRRELDGGTGKVTDDTWRRRFEAINDWEHHLDESGVRVVKVLLHISRREQARRFLQRIDKQQKNWKFSDADIAEHRYYDDYQAAFSAMLSETSTRWAPWHVVPADHKWYARLATSAVLIEALDKLDPQYPKIDPAVQARMLAARPDLEAELKG